MTILQSIILGIIQGLTEFLPVSSSGHLVLVPFFLGWEIPEDPAFVFNVLVQVATLAAVFAYFWRDLLTIIREFIRGLLERRPLATPDARLGWWIIIATIPAGLFGLFLKERVESAFASPVATGIFLFVTAGLLFLGERVGRRTRPFDCLTWQDALVIGLFQAIAIFPGVSRSGATITGGMSRDLERPAAARMSFLMSIPIMLAAGLLAALDLGEIPNLGELVPVMIPGFLAAAVVGYLAIRWLIGYLSRHRLDVFAYYCIALGALVLLTNAAR